MHVLGQCGECYDAMQGYKMRCFNDVRYLHDAAIGYAIMKELQPNRRIRQRLILKILRHRFPRTRN